MEKKVEKTHIHTAKHAEHPVNKAEHTTHGASLAKPHHEAAAPHYDAKASEKKKHMIYAIVAVVAIVILAALILNLDKIFPAAKEMPSGLAAEVNGEKITVAQLEKEYNLGVPQNMREQITKEMFVNESMVPQALLLQEAKKQGITVEDKEVEDLIMQTLQSTGVTKDDLLSSLKDQGVTWEELVAYAKNKQIIKELLEKNILADITVAEGDVNEFYQKNKEKFELNNMTLDSVRKDVEAAILMAKQEAAITTYISQLRGTAKITLYPVIEGAEEAVAAIDSSIGTAGAPVDAKVTELAKCLTSKGAVMFGSYYCPHCNNQKALFGDSFKYITYVECAKGGDDAKRCEDEKISGVPTWKINGKYYPGEQQLDKLASMSGCTEYLG